MTIKAINPATGEQFASYEEMTDAGVQDAIGKAHEAFLAWRRIDFSSRASLMRQAAQVLRDNAGKYAKLMAQEMGKPVRDGVAEIQKCARLRLLRRQRRALSRIGTDQDRSPQEFCSLPTARRRPGGDAVEFSIPAGFPICGAGDDCR
jgi:acyl-CoA reductase-like NAD-dependent aldehyde dehydrogenase